MEEQPLWLLIDYQQSRQLM